MPLKNSCHLISTTTKIIIDLTFVYYTLATFQAHNVEHYKMMKINLGVKNSRPHTYFSGANLRELKDIGVKQRLIDISFS